MKQIINLLIFLSAVATAFSQHIEPKTARPLLTQKEYLSRSNDQLVGGIVLATAGAGLIVLGASVQKKATGFDFTGIGLEAVGIVVIGGSIPLFIVSAHNHQKAKRLAVNIKTENTMAMRQLTFAHQFYPALSIKINL